MRKLHGCVFTLVILHCFIQWVDCTCDANCTCDILPADPRGPHGCFNYGLCTKPYLQPVNASATPIVYRWACTTLNDCVCVNGTSNGTYACSTIDAQCTNSTCGTDSNQHFVCTPGIGSYTCTCEVGYTGTNCDAAINSACAAAMNPCINGGTCRDTSDGGFNCTCPDRSHGERCQYYDFCANDQPCQNGAECANIFNDTNFICKCTDSTQGRYCELSNANIVRKWSPVCYFFDQAKLEDPNNYPYYFDDDHMTHEMCRDRMFSSIDVFTVYTISGNRCYLSYGQHLTSKVVDTSASDFYEFCQVECSGNSYQWCGYPKVRAYVAEFYIDGTDANPCGDTKLCGSSSSRGVCINVLSTTVIDTTTGYFCICAPGYTGSNCGDSIGDPCDPMPCQNGATCIKDDVLHTYTCDCTIGYYGDTCQYEKMCTASTCLNEGTCIDKDGTATCECLTYYHGDRCQEIDRCEYGNPCYNGTCESTPSCIDPTAYTCICSPGYTGVHCENETNECEPNNCQNQATCVDLYLDYNCTCLEGTSGKNCSINKDDCEKIEYNGEWVSPCNTKDEKANCTDLIGGYVCTCSSQWMGPTMEMELISMLEDLMKQPALIKDMVPYILGRKTYEERLNLSWAADDLFDWIAYEEERLDPNLALYMFNDIVLGNCFSFNKILNANYSYNVRDGGTNNGLRAKIRMGQDEYVPWTDTAAILVFVASGTDYIFAESVRYNAEPGGVTIFDVADTRYQRLGGKYGTCIKESKEVPYYYYPGTYSADVRNRYPFPEGGVPCALANRSAVEEAASKNGDPSTWDWCICPPACSNQLYQVTWTRTEYAQFPPECPDHDISCVIEQSDTVHINIRMKSLEYSLFEEIPAMDFNKFISYLGGLLGVLMGISIISFIEVFFLIFRLVSIIISGKNI